MYIASQNIAQYVVLFIFYLVIARILPQSDIGKLSVVLFMASLLGVLTQLALPQAMTKFLSEYMERKEEMTAASVVKTTFTAILATSAFLIMLLPFSSPLAKYIFGTTADAPLLAIVLIGSFTLNLTTFYGGEMAGLGLFGRLATQSLIFVSISRATALFLAWLELGVEGVLLGWLIGSTVTLLVSIVFLRGKLGPQRSASSKFSGRTLILYGYPIVIFSLITIAQGWLDVMLLYALTSNLSIVGLYYLVIGGVSMLSIAWSPIGTTIFPALSARFGRHGQSGVEPALRFITRILNLTVIPLSIGLAATSRTALTLAYGPNYLQGATAFALLACTSIFAAYAGLFTTALQAVGRTAALIKIGAFATTVDLLVLLFLTKPFGIVGAAIGRIAMFAAISILSQQAISGRANVEFDKSLLKAVAIFVPIGAVTSLADWALTDIFSVRATWRMTADVLLFLALALPLSSRVRLFKHEDFDLLRDMLPQVLRRPIGAAERILC